MVGHSDYLNKDLSTRIGWEEIRAIQNDNVYFLNENLANNWGVSTVDLINTLSEIAQSEEDPGLIYLNEYFLFFIFCCCARIYFFYYFF